MVSQAQRGGGIGVSMGRNRRTSNTLQLRHACKARPLRGRAATRKGQQATKNLTPEGADKATETLNSSYLTDPPDNRADPTRNQDRRELPSCRCAPRCARAGRSCLL